MRLALLCQHFYPEMVSTGMHMTELATGLAERGYRIRVFCARPAYEGGTEDGPQEHSFRYRGVDVRRMPAIGNPRGGLLSRGLFAVSFLVATAAFLLRDSRQLAGVIVTTNPPFIGLAAVLTNWLVGTPYVTIVYDVYPDIAVQLGAIAPRSFLFRLWSRVTRVIFGRSTALVVIGRDMEKIVRQKLGELSCTATALIPNWSDERSVQPVLRETNPFVARHGLDGRFVVQYSGRMGRTHNLEPLLEAARLLREEKVLVQLIGDGAKRERLMALADEFRLENVQFLPYQPLEDLDEVLSAADVAVVCLDQRFTGLSVPSKTYGIMASGRPILGFLDPAGEIGLTIAENDCGVILADPDGEQVAKTIRELMANPERRARMGENGRRAFLERYTLSHAVDRYDRLLRQSFTERGEVRVRRTRGES